MNTSGNGICDGCPHFLEEMRACGLLSEGIYLPLRAQVIAFCRTERFYDCPIYKKHFTGSNPNASDKREAEDLAGRRRYERIAEKRNVLLRSCDSIGVAVGDFAERAITVDFSQGGMRVVLNREIPRGTSLLFDFGNDFLIPHLQGVAQLCWHRKLKDNSQGIEAGLVFKDNFSKAVLSLELGN